MKTYVHWAACSLYLTVAAFSDAASFTPIPLNCNMLDSSPVTNRDKRIEVSALGFSVLPPQGENWCVKSLASQGLSFLKAPVSGAIFGQSPSPDELFQLSLTAIRFTGLAVDLPDFGFNTGASLPVVRVTFAGRQVLWSSCVRFDAKVEERGMHQARPGLVMILNFSNNLICAHPQPASSKSPLIWISFVETYREGEQSAADTVRREVDPFLQSLQFMPPR